MLSLGLEFVSETTGCGLISVKNWLVRTMHGLISLVNDNHVDNNLKEILVYVCFGSIVNVRMQSTQKYKYTTRLLKNLACDH